MLQAKEKKPTKEEQAKAEAAALAAKKEAELKSASEAAGSAPEAKFEPTGQSRQTRRPAQRTLDVVPD